MVVVICSYHTRKVFDWAGDDSNRAYVLKYTPTDNLLPSTVMADNLVLTDKNSGEEIGVSSVSYYKDDNSVIIQPTSLTPSTYFLLYSDGLKLANGDATRIAGESLTPLLLSNTDMYDVSVLYTEYTQKGKFLYNLEGEIIFDAAFTIVNASDKDYSDLWYEIAPKSSPKTVLKSGTIDIQSGGYATIEASFNCYVMRENDEMVVTFKK